MSELAKGPLEPDIVMDPRDKKDFGDELTITHQIPARLRDLLKEAGFPEKLTPFITDSNPGDVWSQIFTELDNGAPGSYRALLDGAGRDYPQNQRYRALAERYLADGPAEVVVPDKDLPTTPPPPRTPAPTQKPAPTPSTAVALREPVDARHDPEPAVTNLSDFLRGGRIPDGLVGYVEGKIGSWDELDEFQKNVLLAIRRALASRSAALIYAVTNSGKTTLARFGMNMALSSSDSAVMLLPTKALVAQEESEWLGWANIWNNSDGPKIKVYPASRDYPENDRPVSRGRYDIAVAIYEKLGVYLVSGRRPLSRTAIVVVDELQTLAEDSERAAKLEALLTLIKMLPRKDQPALLGLSAALAPESTEALQSWFGATAPNVVVTNERPVPLDTYVVDEVAWKKQPDAHLLSMPGRQPEAPTDAKHGLRELRHTYEEQLRGKVPSLPTGELAAVLVLDLLTKGESDRRIICFVPSRTAARELSATIQRLLKKRMGRIKGTSPWESGRFAGEASAERGREQRLNEKLAHSDLPERDEIIRGLKEGVAPHSAAYAAPLRRLLESEFREEDGLLRVLVATDTLAVGLNLPADTVIATSIAGYTGSAVRKKRILPPADLDNKGGRAGRRGKTARQRGEFYILVPAAKDLQEIAGVTNQQLEELSQIEGVYREFVTAKTRSVRVSSNFRDLTSISGLVLQVLCQDGFARTEERWHVRVQQILDGLLIAHEEPEARGELPTSQQVLEDLTERSLIVRRKRTGDDRADRLSLSGMGAALGRSGLDLESASDLERLARLSCNGAGVIDLVWNACRSRSIQSVTDWLSLPPVARRHYPSLTEAIITMALAYCGGSVERRRDCARLIQTEKHPLPTHLVEHGDVVVSRELKELLKAEPEDIPDSDVNALLRALVAYEWSRGIPFGDIRARFSSAIHSDETRPREQPVEVRMYYSDVEQLCEQLAGILRTAADLSFTEDGFDHSGQMRILAQEIEAGLPAWLAPVAKLRIPVLHRQRLAQLWNTKPPDRLADILDQDPLYNHPGISTDDLEHAKRTIERYEEEEREQRNRIAREWADQDIPNSGGQTFEDLADDLDEAANSVDYLKLISGLVEGLGAEAGAVETGSNFATTKWSKGRQSVTVKVAHGTLAPEAVSATTEDSCLILVREIAPAAKSALMRPTRARFVQPEHLLSLLASLVKGRGDGLTGDEVIDSIRQIRVSSLDGDGWYLYRDAVSAPPPFIGEDLPELATPPDILEVPTDDELG